LLLDAAQAFLGVTGGAIGVILAKMLMGAAAALRDATELGPAQLSAMLGGMESGIAKAGKVKPGDKTILDAVHAANAAGVHAIESQQPFADMLQAVAEAAETAAQQTAAMVCRVGRASRLGDRTLGHPDPGAVSFSIIMRAFQRAAAIR
jgi:dihydroxyacetone kinase-like protein